MNNDQEFNASILDATKALTDLRNGTKFLVWHHMIGCGHCIHMKDEWKKAKEQLNAEKNLHVIELEFKQLTNLKAHHGGHPLAVFGSQVNGFPHVQLVNVKDGRFHITPYEYWYQSNAHKGLHRSAKSFVNFVKHCN